MKEEVDEVMVKVESDGIEPVGLKKNSTNRRKCNGKNTPDAVDQKNTVKPKSGNGINRKKNGKKPANVLQKETDGKKEGKMDDKDDEDANGM